MNDSFLGIEYDKYVHFLMFLPFPILFWINLVLKKKSPKWPIVITFIIGLTLSAFTEISQWLFLKSRTGDIMDLMADLVGIIVGTIIIFIIKQKLPFKFFTNREQSKKSPSMNK